MKIYSVKTILSAFLLFLAGLSFGQSGNLQYFIVGTDTVLYNLDDVIEVVDKDDQVVMTFFKPTISVTAEMTLSQFMARSCSQFVRVTLPSGVDRAYNKRFITHVKKNANTGKAALYMMEQNRTVLTAETVSYVVTNYTVCGGIDVGEGAGETVDSFYYTGQTLTLETSEREWDVDLTDGDIEIGESLNICGTSYFPGTTLKEVLEAIDACLVSYEASVHPPLTLGSPNNAGLILDTTNQQIRLDLDADNSYSNIFSGLTAITIQDAIDELAERGDALGGPFLVFELDTTLTNESQLVPDSTAYLTTSGDTTTFGVAAGGIAIIHLDSILRDSIFNVAGDYWDLNGNAVGGYGKFIGTIDSQKLYIRTNDIERLWVSEVEDRLYIGDSLRYGTMAFDSSSGEGFVFQTYRDDLTPASDPIRFRIKTDGSKTIFYEPLSIHEEWITIGLGIKDNAGSLGTAGQVATSDGSGWTWEDVDALPAADRTETLWYDGSEWVADSTIANSGDSVVINAGSNMPFRIHTGIVNVMKVTNGGELFLSDATKASSLFPVLTTTALPDAANGLGMMFYTRGTTETNYPGLALTGMPLFSTSGLVYDLHISKNFTPTSGTGAHTGIFVGGTINQTGGSTGATIGLDIGHVLTAAPNYTAINISTGLGKGIYQSSTTPTNHLAGNTIIGATSTPAQTLHVEGTARITGSVTGADVLLGVATADGDVGRLQVGDGLYISGDTLYAAAADSTDLDEQELYIQGDSLYITNGNGIPLDSIALVDTIDLDEQELYVQGDSLYITNGNGIPLDSIAAGIGPGAPYYLARWGTDSITLNHGLVYDSLNVGIATKTPTAQLDVLGDGTTNTTRAFRVADSGNSTMFVISDDGISKIGGAVAPPQMYPFTATTLASVSKTGQGLGFYSNVLNSSAFGFTGINVSSTSGTATTLHVQRGFTAASGTATYNHVLLDPTINQTGGASGYSYGLRVTPTLTSAANWVSVSLENSSGIGLHQSGASVNNMINGNTHFGATTAGIRQLQVTGDLRVSADVDTATVARLWGGNTQGDLRKLKPTGNLVISNDTLNSPHYYFTIEDATSGPGRVYSTDGIQVLATGSVTATMDTTNKILTINGLGPAGSGGETNLGLNVGGGEEIYKGKTDTTLLFRTLVDDGLTTVTQQGDSIVINTPAQTLSTSNDSIYISAGNGVKVPGTIANGTTYNSTLRWNNVIWKQNDLMLADSLGHTGIGAAIQTTRSITTAKDIEVNGIRMGRGQANDIDNIAIGIDALKSASSQGGNTAIGTEALMNHTQSGTVAIGNSAFRLNTTGHSNTGVGEGVGNFSSTLGVANTFVGRLSARSNTSSNNVAMGNQAIYSQTSSGSNTAIGAEALRAATGGGLTFNTVVGGFAARNATVTGSSFFGANSGYNSTSDFSIFAGYNSGYNVTKDSTLFLDVGSDSTAAIVGDLRNNKIGINGTPWTIDRTLDVNGDLRVVSNVDTATVTRLWAGNTQGDMRRVKLGTNLSFSTDTLNATGGGGGIPFDSTFTPTKIVGIDAGHDTLTDIHVDFFDYGISNGQVKNTRLQSDTIISLRGSYAQVFEQSAWTKIMAGSTIDTLDIDNNEYQHLFDFTSNNGVLTHDFGPEETIPPGYSYIQHVLTINASISVSVSSPAEATLAIYQNNNLLNYCYAEFELENSNDKRHVHISCIVMAEDGDFFDVRLENVETTPRTFRIDRANININHIKTLIGFNE